MLACEEEWDLAVDGERAEEGPTAGNCPPMVTDVARARPLLFREPDLLFAPRRT